MSEEDLEQDELEQEEGESLEAVEADEEEEAREESAELPVASKRSKAVAEEDELPSLQVKQREREALEKAMAEFLARGGHIQQIEPSVLADPPKKPDSKYGSRPI